MIIGDIIDLVVHAGGSKDAMILYEGASVNKRVASDHSSFK